MALTQMQQKLLEMLSWFHDFCVKNGICYYIVGGTMLGAKRHNGFIPWDDDVDVALPRPDYEKLKTLFDHQIGNYILETPYNSDDDYLYSFSKIYDVTTTLIEKTRRNCKRGIYIDVFPLDGIGNTRREAIRNYRKYNLVKSFALTRCCAVRKERSIYKNLAIIGLRVIPQFIINDKEVSKLVDKKAKKVSYEESKYVGNLMGAYGIKEVMEKECFGKPTLYAFEGIRVYGVEKFDEFLRNIYFDWTVIPSETKRGGAHAPIYCDLSKSYRDD